MKKYYTLILAIGIVSYSFGQALLTRSNSGPHLGDKYTYYTVDSNATPGPDGMGQTWDFSNFTGYGTSYQMKVVGVSTTPDGGDFTKSQWADTSTVEDRYYTGDNDSLNRQGIVIKNYDGGKVIVNFKNDDQKLLNYPFGFGDTFSDSVSGEATVSVVPTAVALNGHSTTEGDAKGTLKLPNGKTFSNVMRVKRTTELSGNIPIIGAIEINITEYNFYNPSTSKYPLLQFTFNHIEVGGTPQDINVVSSQYPLKTTGIEDLSNNISKFNISPNPASINTKINIQLKKKQNVSLKVYDVTGKTIKTIVDHQSISEGTYTINTTQFAKGLYTIVLKSKNGMSTKRLVVE